MINTVSKAIASLTWFVIVTTHLHGNWLDRLAKGTVRAAALAASGTAIAAALTICRVPEPRPVQVCIADAGWSSDL